MLAPVGIGGECLKVCPPLSISEEALRESIDVFEEAVEEVLGGETAREKAGFFRRVLNRVRGSDSN